MGVKIINNSGNGKFVDDSIIGWSYSEEVTSLEPSTLKGATGQVSVRGIEVAADKDGATHPNTKLMINNVVTLFDDDYGNLDLQIRAISTNAGVATITADTLQWRFNATRTALPVPNASVAGNLFSAIEYYCGLVGAVPNISPALTTELSAITVSFIGWTGNLWEHLKMLCSAVSASNSVTSPIEMYVDSMGIGFRKAKTTLSELDELKSDYSLTVDAKESAKEVEVFQYKTSNGTDRVVYEQSNYDENVDPSKAFLASISDGMQVEAGETVTKRFKINATLETINQPTCVSTITRTPPLPYVGTTGQYVVVGTDNLPILPTQWEALGGSLTVSLTDVPDEIEVSITAPPLTSIEQTSGGQAYAPYKIGVESSGEADYPALWITGSGVFFEKISHIFITGAPDSYAPSNAASTIDNPFLTTLNAVTSRGVAAAQEICGPKVTMSASIAQGNQFGSTVGRMEALASNKFRIESASYSESSVSLDAVASASISDFNAKWTGKTFTNFKNIALDYATYAEEALLFNEFTVIPLMEAN